jgi:RNA polymerase sigma factor (sigma-70 family)
MNDNKHIQLTSQLERLQAMDEAAWEELLERYSKRLYDAIVVSLRKRGLNESSAEDIQQQTWLTAVQRIDEFVPEANYSLYYWLRVIALNHVRNLARKTRYTVSFEEVDDTSEEKHTSLDIFMARHDIVVEGPEEQVIAGELSGMVLRVLDDYKPYQRDIFLKRVLWDVTPTELALNYPDLKPRSISQLLTRIKKGVRAQYNIL